MGNSVNFSKESESVKTSLNSFIIRIPGKITRYATSLHSEQSSFFRLSRSWINYPSSWNYWQTLNCLLLEILYMSALVNKHESASCLSSPLNGLHSNTGVYPLPPNLLRKLSSSKLHWISLQSEYSQKTRLPSHYSGQVFQIFQPSDFVN